MEQQPWCIAINVNRSYDFDCSTLQLLHEPKVRPLFSFWFSRWRCIDHAMAGVTSDTRYTIETARVKQFNQFTCLHATPRCGNIQWSISMMGNIFWKQGLGVDLRQMFSWNRAHGAHYCRWDPQRSPKDRLYVPYGMTGNRWFWVLQTIGGLVYIQNHSGHHAICQQKIQVQVPGRVLLDTFLVACMQLWAALNYPEHFFVSGALSLLTGCVILRYERRKKPERVGILIWCRYGRMELLCPCWQKTGLKILNDVFIEGHECAACFGRLERLEN